MKRFAAAAVICILALLYAGCSQKPDMSLELDGSPELMPGGMTRLAVKIRNNGSSDAGPFTFKLAIPEGVRLKRKSGSRMFESEINTIGGNRTEEIGLSFSVKETGSFTFTAELLDPDSREVICTSSPYTVTCAGLLCLIKTSMGDITVNLFRDSAPETVDNFVRLAEGEKEFRDQNSGKMVKRPFYDGLVFHRVIKNFMIQGGCPRGDGTGDPGYKFKDEINADSLGLDTMKVIDEKGAANPRLGIRNQDAFNMTVMYPLMKKMGINDQETFNKRLSEFQDRMKNLTIKELYEMSGYSYRTDLKSHPPLRGYLAMANSGPDTNGSQFFINLVNTPWLTGKHTVFGKVVDGMDVVDRIGEVKVDAKSRPVEEVKIISIRRLSEREGTPSE